MFIVSTQQTVKKTKVKITVTAELFVHKLNWEERRSLECWNSTSNVLYLLLGSNRLIIKMDDRLQFPPAVKK